MDEAQKTDVDYLMSLNFMPYLININILKCHKLDLAAAGEDPGKVALLEFVDIVDSTF